MAVKIKLTDLNIKNNIITLNKNIFNIEKINKIILRGFHNLIDNEIYHNITINHLFNIYNILNTIDFYCNLKIYFTLHNVLYSNIHDTDITGSFANNIYQNNDQVIYINMPFYKSNCYYIQSIPFESEVLKNGIFVYDFLTFQSILSLYNPLLFRIINLIKIISSSFFLSEYLRTEYIEFAYINSKNIYFNNVIEFINYCDIMNIHIENALLYKQCYNKKSIEIFNILKKHFNLHNINFNLPNDIDIIHYNCWNENIYTINADNINCEKYQLITHNLNIKIQPYTNQVTYKLPTLTYTFYINTLLNNINSLYKIYNNNLILSSWQIDNLKLIWKNLTFINNTIYYNQKKCYLTLYKQLANTNYTYIYNLDTGNLIVQ